MAVLQNIRVKFGLAISIIIALALLSFIIDPNTLESALHSMSSKYDVGKMAGKSISYTDFQENVDKFTTIHQIATGSSVQNEQSQQQIRAAAWQDYLDRYVFVKNAKNAGIRVGEEEIVDLTTGNAISPVLANNPAFADETGAYSADVLRDFVQNQVPADGSGRLRTFWNYLQNAVMVQKYYDKYAALYNNSYIQPELFAKQAITEHNTTFDVDYVMVPFDYSDSTVTVSSAEVRAYYKAHKENYKQDAGRDIEYVVYEVVPSAADIQKTSDDINAVVEDFDTATNLKAFLLKNSERSYSEHWYKKGELANNMSSDIDEFVFSGAQGASPVYKSGNVFRSVRVMASANVPDSVYVKHILLQGANAKHQADSLCKVASARGTNFSNLVALYSVDQNSADEGELGNLGWFTQNYIIPGFEPAITAEVGKPFVLNTQYGTHVVVVTKRSKPIAKKQVAVLEKTALASKETFNDFYSQANRFATIAAGTLEGYKKAVDSTGVYSHTMNNVTEATANYGSVSQAKEITRWVYDNKKGKASNIITVNNNFFFVVALKDIREEGYKDVKDVASSIHETLKTQKLQEVTKAKVSARIEGMTTLDQVAEELKVGRNQREEISFASMGRSYLEPALVGAASVAPEAQLCGPVAGQSCVYVFTVANRQTASFFTAEDAANEDTQKAQYGSQMVMPTMMEYDEVVDNKARFF